MAETDQKKVVGGRDFTLMNEGGTVSLNKYKFEVETRRH